MHLWDRLPLQAITTLILLANILSTLVPWQNPSSISQYISIKCHCPSPGIKVTVYSKPYNQHTWDAHGLDVWYVSQAPEHYQSYKVYITNTCSDRTSDTVEFLPTQVNMPKVPPHIKPLIQHSN